MLPAILGLGGLTAKIIATAVIPRVVRAISSSFSTTRPAELCPPTPVEGISSVPEPAPAPVLSGVSGTRFSSRKWSYAGLWHHQASGLDLATYRLYDAANKRWISRDPLGEGVDYNLYRYCGNSPIGRIDPEGLWEIPFPLGGATIDVIGLGEGLSAIGAGIVEGLEVAGPYGAVGAGGGLITHSWLGALEAEEEAALAEAELIKTQSILLAKGRTRGRGQAKAKAVEKCPIKGGHSKNKSKSREPKHEKGDTRRGKDQWRTEKGDKRRPY